MKHPDERYTAPQIVAEKRNSCGDVVSQIVRADSHADATRHLQGTTIQGDRSIVATKIKKGLWDVHIEEWDTGRIGRGMRRSENYDAGAYLNRPPKRQPGMSETRYAEWLRELGYW